MAGDAFHNDVFGVLFDVDREQLVAVTRHFDGEVSSLSREEKRQGYSTDEVLLPEGEFSFTLMCSGCTLGVEGGRATVELVDENKKLSKRFK